MSYDFNYDPNTNETPWPLAWTVTPEQYNFEGTLGQDVINFSVEAIPDPDYPDAWNDHYSDPLDPNSTVPELPPEPELEEYVVHRDAGDDRHFKEEYYSVDLANGFVISELDIRLFFPFESLKYMKDGQEKEAQIPQEIIDDNFNYIFEFVPDQRQSIDKIVDLEAVSNSKSTLRDTFWFLCNNDWDEARSTLDQLVQISKQYFDDLGDSMSEGGPPEGGNENSENEKELSPSESPEEEDTKTFVQSTGLTYDELFSKENPNEIQQIIDDNGGQDFISRLVEESEQSETQEEIVDNPLKAEGKSMDQILRENSVNDLMEKYDLTFEEIITLLQEL